MDLSEIIGKYAKGSDPARVPVVLSGESEALAVSEDWMPPPEESEYELLASQLRDMIADGGSLEVK